MPDHPSFRRHYRVSGFPTQVSGFQVEKSQSASPRASSDGSSTREIDSRKPSHLPERTKQEKFAFVYHTGPTVEDRESKRLIKKHVMIDIGKSRRKDPSTRKKPQKVPDDATNVQPNDFHEQSLDCYNDDTKLDLVAQSLGSVSRFSTTRDPFIVRNYPIQVNHRTCALIDHCEHPGLLRTIS